MRRWLIAALVSCFGIVAAHSQTSPNWSQGYTPTTAQWNAAFASKQDFTGGGVLPLNGGTLTGKLTTAASLATIAGFNIPQGVAPTSPTNGDMWVTTAGLFLRVNGSTIGPIGTAACANCAVTTITNTFVAQQIFSLNNAALPIAATGTVIDIGGADSTAARLQVTAFGAVPTFTSAAYGGTNVAQTAVTSGTEVGAFNAWAYNGATLAGAIASFRMYAAENIASGHQGSQACIATTPIGSTTMANWLCQGNDGGVTIGSPTGGDEGAGTLNAVALYTNGILIPGATITINGVPCTLSSTCAITATAASVTIGTTTTIGGTNNFLLSYGSGTLANVSIASVLTAGSGIAITGTTNATISTSFVPTPGGRLTLASHTPVMATSVPNATTIFYDSYVHGSVPVYNGSTDVILPIGSNEISDALPASSTGVVNSGNVFDEWLINVSGTLMPCHATNGTGGGWASDTGGSNTTRGTGYSKIDNTTRAYYTNANPLPNCYTGGTNRGTIPANQAAYAGTFYANLNGQVSWIFPGIGPPPAAGLFGLWNAYNRIEVVAQVGDSFGSWNYSSSTVREIHGDTTAIIQYVRGLAQDATLFTAVGAGQNIGSNIAFGNVGICYNVTNAFSGLGGAVGYNGAVAGGSTGFSSASAFLSTNDTGFNFTAECENAINNTVTFFGSDAGPPLTGMTMIGRF